MALGPEWVSMPEMWGSERVYTSPVRPSPMNSPREPLSVAFPEGGGSREGGRGGALGRMLLGLWPSEEAGRMRSRGTSTRVSSMGTLCPVRSKRTPSSLNFRNVF